MRPRQEIVLARVRTQLSLAAARKKSDELLHNVLPQPVVEELKAHGRARPVQHDAATILFLDLVSFTRAVAELSPLHLIDELNAIYTELDRITERHGCERIKTIGDCYMAAGGVPTAVPDHAARVVRAARDMRDFLHRRAKGARVAWEARIGVHSGPLVSGVVGVKRFAFDVFGDTVNVASRIEHASEPMRVTVSADTARLLPEDIPLGPPRTITARGKGELVVHTCFPRP